MRLNAQNVAHPAEELDDGQDVASEANMPCWISICSQNLATDTKVRLEPRILQGPSQNLASNIKARLEP